MKNLLLLIAFFTMSSGAWAQVTKVTVSGIIQDKQSNAKLPYVNVIVKSAHDSVFVAGTVTDDQGLFSLAGIAPGNYIMELSYLGFTNKAMPLLVGRLSDFKL